MERTSARCGSRVDRRMGEGSNKTESITASGESGRDGPSRIAVIDGKLAIFTLYKASFFICLFIVRRSLRVGPNWPDRVSLRRTSVTTYDSG